jgi:hypothetical protein
MLETQNRIQDCYHQPKGHLNLSISSKVHSRTKLWKANSLLLGIKPRLVRKAFLLWNVESSVGCYLDQ